MIINVGRKDNSIRPNKENAVIRSALSVGKGLL